MITKIDLAEAVEFNSIAVNGVCLTVTQMHGDGFSVDLSAETLRRSNLGNLRPGDLLDLDRSLAMGGRVGGHFVQGHIDGTGTVQMVTPEGQGKIVRIAAPPDVMRYVVAKGYIAVDGMSLTVVEPDERSFAVAFIPHTRAHSVAGHYRPGATLNLEADVLGKYVERFLTHQEPGAKQKDSPSPPAPSSTSPTAPIPTTSPATDSTWIEKNILPRHIFTQKYTRLLTRWIAILNSAYRTCARNCSTGVSR